MEVLFEIGLSKSGGFGAVPMDWQDIYAYCALTSTQLTREEVLLLRRLSRAYVSQLNSSKEDNTPAPYHDTQRGAVLLFANHPNRLKRTGKTE